MLLDVAFKIIEHGTAEYKSAASLRERILRASFGLSFSEEELLAEKSHIQIVGSNGAEIIATAVLVPDGQHCKMQRVVVKELGTLLLNQVEANARVMGATLIHLDTFDFQAKDFYLKHGYEIFGVLDNCPAGQKHYEILGAHQ